LSVLVKISA